MPWYQNNELLVAVKRRRAINPYTSETFHGLDCRESDGGDIGEESNEFVLLLRFDVSKSTSKRFGSGIEVKNLRAFDAKGIDLVPILLRGGELYCIYEFIVDTWKAPDIGHHRVDGNAALMPCPVCGALPESGLGPAKGELPYSRVWCGANGATWGSSHARIEHISCVTIVQAWNREEPK